MSTGNHALGNHVLKEVASLDPREAAEHLVALQSRDNGWLDAFAEHLDRRRPGQPLERVLKVWGLSQSEAARLFGVSRQALSKWLDSGTPSERVGTVADMAAATDLLVRYLKRERIPAAVRRPIPSLSDLSLVDLLGAGQSRLMLQTCRAMFDFGNAQG
ncbi:MAG: hypothetical protein AAFN78_17955 [Pseudomonadota bacterium]